MDTNTQTGLTSAEAAARLKQFGPNSISHHKRLQPIVAFVRTLNSPLLWIIIVAALVSMFVGQRTDAIILLLMVSISVTLDYTNTSRSANAVEKLISRVVTMATVVRDGQSQSVPLDSIVPGDMVVLQAGNVIPADGELLTDKDFYVNQSTLTGESMPVPKHSGQPSQHTDRLEDETKVSMGTSVVSGEATMIVTATGPRTAFGKIIGRLSSADTPTDFDRGIRQFSFFLIRVTIVMVATVFILNAAFHHGWLESFIFAIAIAIGLTPELLPVILTVSLSHGAVQMSKKRVIVKHLPAIQNFGRMNILCTDKTGTLTENNITVVKYVDAFGQADEEILRQAFVSSSLHTGVFNPLEDAIRKYRSWDLGQVKKIEEIPFDFERRRQSVVVEDTGQRRLIVKGAPEAMIAICNTYRRGNQTVNIDEAFRQQVEKEYTALSQDGFRVLTVASRSITPEEIPYEPDDEHGLTFMGFIALLDPPKAGVKETIDELEQLGIGIKILTGDGLLLTEKICRDIGLPSKGSMTGEQLRDVHGVKWAAVVQNTTIFARIDPEQKEKIIAHLRQAGNVVGFMGDGINDAPALKAADVGVSVNNAVDVAKETADIILLEHSLAVLKDGVREGRKTFHNTMKYIMMSLSSNFGNMVSMTAASAFLPFLPMLPTQILLNNFIYDSSQLTLSTDAVDDQDLTQPTTWNINFVRRFMFIFGSVSSLFDFATFGLLLWVFRLNESGFQTGWFIESIATQIFVIYVIRTRRLPFLQSRPSVAFFLNTFLAVALAWIIPFLPFNHLLGLRPLPWNILLPISGIVLVYLFMTEGLKHWFYRRWSLQRA